MTPEEAFDAALHRKWVVLERNTDDNRLDRCLGANWRFPTLRHPRASSFDYNAKPYLLVALQRNSGCLWHVGMLRMATEEEAVLGALGATTIEDRQTAHGEG